MTGRCEAEVCSRWTGDGCICAVLGLDPDVSEHGMWEQADLTGGEIDEPST